jgi:hypothetical protein
MRRTLHRNESGRLRTKRLVTVLGLFASALLAPWLVAPANAQLPGELTAGVSATEPVDGSSGIMHIYVHNARALGAWTVDVRYDPNVIQVRQCAPTLQVGTCSFGGGTIRTLGDTGRGASGDLTLARLFFDCVPGAASTNLDLTVVGLADASLNEPFDNIITQDDVVDCGGDGNAPGGPTGGPGGPGPGSGGGGPDGAGGGGNGSPTTGGGAIPVGLPATGAADTTPSGQSFAFVALLVAAGLSALILAHRRAS